MSLAYISWDSGMPFIFAVVAALVVLNEWTKPKYKSLTGQHVVITGGSSGIGLELAKECARRKAASVTILANKMDGKFGLTAAKQAIEEIAPGVAVKVIFGDVTDGSSMAVLLNGEIDVLINCAGFAECGLVEEMNMRDHRRMMDVNYFGAVNCTHAVLKRMKERGHGSVVLVSSGAGQVGVYGMSGYVASKFALRGFGEALDMECKPHNIRVSVVFPPDTDTPGFARENENKPEITRIISETAGTWDPQVVALKTVKGIESGQHHISFGLEGGALSIGTVGMAPATTIGQGLLQIFTMSFLRIIGIGTNIYFRYICAKFVLAQKKKQC